MLYFTQFLYVRPGTEAVFHQFEESVLPLLARHGGRLLYRVRPAADAVIASEIGVPYEVHLVAFPSREAFTAYVGDPERFRYADLKNESVGRSLLIEGAAI